MDPFEEIKKKYGASTQSSSQTPIDPFNALRQKIDRSVLDTRLATFKKRDDAEIEKTQKVGFFKDVLPGIPKAAKQIVSNPIESGAGVVAGALNLGPSIVNGMRGLIGNRDRLPMPGEKFIEFLDKTTGSKFAESDVTEAVAEGTKQFGAYELGGAVVRPLFGVPLGGLTKNGTAAATSFTKAGTEVVKTRLGGQVSARIAGNVAGGQLVVPDDYTAKDRAKQAVFDAVFGAATEVVGPAFRYVKGKKQVIPTGVDVPTPRFGDEVPGAVREQFPEGTSIIEEPITTPFETPPIQKPKPQTVFKEKKLGKDPINGETIFATHEFDSKTGNSIVYTDPFLNKIDSNAEMAASFREQLGLPEGTNIKQFIIEHETAHIIDKRLNNGKRLSPELSNYDSNSVNLESVLGKYAQETGDTVQALVKKMSDEIETLSAGRGKTPGEKFAEAYSRLKSYPEKAAETAPTFKAFLENATLRDPEFSSHTSTPSVVKQERLTGKLVDKPTPVSKQRAPGAGRPSKGSKIASTGLDTGKRVDKTSSFRADKINSAEDLDILLNKVDAQSQNSSGNRVSKSMEDIRDLSRMVGITEKDLLAAKPGSIVNAETLQASRQLVLNAADELRQFLKSVNPDTATGVQLKEVKKRFLRLVGLQKAVGGFRTEASSVFRSLQGEISPGENFQLKMLAEDLRKLDDVATEGDLSLFAGKVAEQYNMTKLEKVGNRALSTWYASILSGPKTSIRNILGTSMNIMTDLASRAANPKTAKEVPSIVSAWLRALPEAREAAKQAFKGKVVDSKFTDIQQSVREQIWEGKWSTYGKIVETVGRFLNAQDQFLQTVAREGEKAGLKVYSPAVSDELANAISRAYAESSVYRGVPKGKRILALRNSIQSFRKSSPESKLIIPFVDTVANVIDRNFDYIPITAALRLRDKALDPQVQRIAREFNLTSPADLAAIKTRLRDQQMGRLIVGTGVSVGAITLASFGKISGVGPSNYQERLQLQRGGWRPNSIKIGDTWIPYTYLGPLGGILSMAGNVADKKKYDNSKEGSTIAKSIGLGLVGFAQTQLDQSFLSGVADLFDVLVGKKDPVDYLNRLGAGLVPIPAAYSQTKDMIFRQQYETKDIVSALRQKLGLTGNAFGLDPLNIRQDAFGNPMRNDLIFGITPSRETKDQVDNFLISNDIILSLPSKTTKYTNPLKKGETVQLTADEYQEYVKTSGEQIYQKLNASLPNLNRLDADRQKKTVDKIRDDIRERVRRQILLRRGK